MNPPTQITLAKHPGFSVICPPDATCQQAKQFLKDALDSFAYTPLADRVAEWKLEHARTAWEQGWFEE